MILSDCSIDLQKLFRRWRSRKASCETAFRWLYAFIILMSRSIIISRIMISSALLNRPPSSPDAASSEQLAAFNPTRLNRARMSHSSHH